MANSIAGTTSTSTATATETSVPFKYDFSCRHESGCGAGPCLLPVRNKSKRGLNTNTTLSIISDPRLTLVRNITLQARGDFKRGDWADPLEDFGGDHARFMTVQAEEAKSGNEEITPYKEVPMPSLGEASVTSTNYVVFEDKPTGLLVQGLYGCTSVIVVSKRGAWAAHIWEPDIRRNPDQSDAEYAAQFKTRVQQALWKGSPDHPHLNERGFSNMTWNIVGGQPTLRADTAFGGPPVLKDGKLKWSLDKEDLLLHAYIVVARERPDRPTRDHWGNWHPPESLRMDGNSFIWPQNIPAAMEEGIAAIERNLVSLLFEQANQPVRTSRVLYAPVMADDATLTQVEKLEPQLAVITREVKELKEIMDSIADEDSVEWEDAQELYNRRVIAANELITLLQNTNDINKGDRDRTSHRGKVLIQYQPAKWVCEHGRHRVRHEASFRVFFEDQPAAQGSSRFQSWKPYDYQWWEEGTSVDFDDTDSDSDGDGMRKRQEGAACELRPSSLSVPESSASSQVTSATSPTSEPSALSASNSASPKSSITSGTSTSVSSQSTTPTGSSTSSGPTSSSSPSCKESKDCNLNCDKYQDAFCSDAGECSCMQKPWPACASTLQCE